MKLHHPEAKAAALGCALSNFVELVGSLVKVTERLVAVREDQPAEIRELIDETLAILRGDVAPKIAECTMLADKCFHCAEDTVVSTK